MNPYINTNFRRFGQANYYTTPPVESRQFVNNNVNPQGVMTSQYGPNNFIDISHSTLQPAAAEFRPSSSYNQQQYQQPRFNEEVAHSSHSLNGAVRKQKRQNYKPREFNNRNYNKHNKQKNDLTNLETSKSANTFQTQVNRSSNNDLTPQNSEDVDDIKENREKSKYDRKYNNRGYNNYYKDNWYNKRRQFKSSENWRENKSDNNVRDSKNFQKDRKADKSNQKPQKLKSKLNAASQRERLIEMLNHRMLECLVCCEKLRHTDKVWSCKQCYHIIHLNCVLKWAQSSKLENGWRCPACQNVCLEVPKEYRCFCDKYAEPQLETNILPHSCGELCSRKRRHCEHPCTILCHPGPCPECNVMVQRSCSCGATKPIVICSSDIQITCSATCNKLLNCKIHKCIKICHIDECQPCEQVIKQTCFCGQDSRELECSADEYGVEKYSCDNVCGKTLSCNEHKCEKLCHEGECEDCVLDPKNVKTCPCGQTKFKEQRNSCLDPIPCCDKICNKRLKCGQPSDPHVCKQVCHEGKCPTCPLSTTVKCRCGHMDKEIQCKDLTSKADDARCQKRCTKKRLCCKHKCNQLCCIEIEHPCPLPCNRLQSCGIHKCLENCHRGNCPPCWRTSFEELYCECGATVLYPPVACGTKPPMCSQPCSRERSCGHPVNHNCHTGPCPVCTIFTTRYCHGKHQSRQTIPCHQEDFSCGMPCNKLLACGRHKCIQTCHKGECPSTCTQPCTIQREHCIHVCNQPCHDPPCVYSPCKQMVTVTCQCGLRSSKRMCMDLAVDYQRISILQLTSKLSDLQAGHSIDVSDIIKVKKGEHKTLDCNDECRLVERNRRLAIGLQIRNPDLSSKLTPRYSDFMRIWAKKDPKFCEYVHDKLTELVQLAKQSKQKNRSHSFECMNRDKRHFVHEYCEHFGCESAAYDKEPNRNIVATAYRDKSWLPSVGLVELLKRENGQRKVPGPVLNKNDRIDSSASSESVSLRLQSRNLVYSTTPPTGEVIDYFDNP